MEAIELTTTMKNKIIEAHTFWFTKRLLFNILVGISGTIGLSLNWVILFFDFFDLIFIIPGVLIWGLIANGPYSLGFETDSYLIHKTKGLKSFGNHRIVAFWLGTLSYVMASVYFPLIMCFPIPA